MTRKSDFKRKCPLYKAFPWSDEQVSIVTEVDENGFVRKTVHFVETDCEEISKQTLNPQDTTLSSILASGVVIPPQGVAHLFDFSDIADREASALEMSDIRLNYLNEHKSELVDVLKENGLTSILNNDEN